MPDCKKLKGNRGREMKTCRYKGREKKSTNNYQLHSVKWKNVSRWKRWIYVKEERKESKGRVSE